MAGMELPEILGKKKEDEIPALEEENQPPVALD